MIRKILIFLFCFTALIMYAKDEKDEKKSDEKELYKFKLNAKTSFEFKFIDTSNDSNNIEVGPYKNSPIINEDIDFFLRVLGFKDASFIIGPYAESNLEFKLEYTKLKNSTTNYNFTFEKFYGDNSAGLKIGKEFGNANMKGSKFTFNIPLTVIFNINDSDDFITPSSKMNSIDFYSYLYIGSKLGFNLDVVYRYIEFEFDNYSTFTKEMLNSSNKENGYYIEEKNILEFAAAPFNFINEKVGVWFSLYNKFSVYNNGYHTGISEKTYINIEYKGLKYVTFGYKPFLYNYDIKVPNENPEYAYDQEQNINMEFTFSAGNKYVDFEIAYQLPLWALKGTSVNTDDVKVHSIKSYIELKF